MKAKLLRSIRRREESQRQAELLNGPALEVPDALLRQQLLGLISSGTLGTDILDLSVVGIEKAKLPILLQELIDSGDIEAVSSVGRFISRVRRVTWETA